jgi:predicted Zn-dependent protease
MSERGIPNWLSTHPEPGSRVGAAAPLVTRFASEQAATRNRDKYLETIDGLVVGDSVEQGIVRGHVFLHPMLRIALDFPEGWEVVNSPDQVVAREPGSQHYMLLQMVAQPRGRTIEEVARDAMRRAGYRPLDGSSGQVGGLDAYVGVYRGSIGGVGRVLMRAAHIAVGRQVYVVAGFAPEGEFDRANRAIEPAIRTFRALTPQEAAAIRPNRLAFYVVRAGDSWQSIAQRAGQGITSASTLALMNGREVSEQPQPGDRIRIVVGG